MLILPIINKNRILNVQISLKNSQKTRQGVNFVGIKESDVVVNQQHFSASLYKNSNEEVINFIRNSSILYKRNYTVTTKVDPESKLYDVYEVGYPPEKISECLDKLYSRAVTDMMMETPGVNKSKYISFKELGFDKHLTDEKLEKLYEIVREVSDTSRWPELFKKADIFDLVETLDFLELFDCTVVGGSSIAENTFQDMLTAFEKLNSRDTKSLRRYFNIATDNREIYSKLSYVNKLLYNKPYTLIQSDNQRKSVQFVKTNIGGDYNKAA